MNKSKNECKRKPEDTLVELNRKPPDKRHCKSRQSFGGQWRREKDKGMSFQLSHNI